MKKKELIKDYLSYNRTELRGIFVFLLILVGLLMVHAIFPKETWQKQIDFSSFEKEVAIFEKAWQKAKEEDALKKKEKYSRNRFFSHFSNMDSLKRNRVPEISFTVELNSADTFDLQRLRGIGPSFARRIIAYRERLGGFLNKKQLLEVWGMDTARYAFIEAFTRVVADSVKKINLNDATFKELLRHPYFPFELTKSIMQYRQKIKKFSNMEELRNIQGVNDSVYHRIIPYLRFDP